jgi:hypothetical protein
MIVIDYCRLSHPDVPMAASYGSRAMCEEWRGRMPVFAGRTRESYLIEPVSHCGCCGAIMPYAGSLVTWPDGATRCSKHHDRNPCAIEGCRRTAAADGRYGDDQWLCGEHWRRYVPPRGLRRTTYLWFFRQARKHGWGWKGPDGKSARLDWRFHRYWDVLVRQARRRAKEGHIDEAAINRLMGWDG